MDTVYSVSEFNAIVAGYLSEGLGTIAVQGEVVDFKIAKGTLIFFELKDAQARVGCFMMRHELYQSLEDGMEVKVTGRANLFKQSGRFHIRVIGVELVGSGSLARAFQLLKAKLEHEGLFAPERKRALPRFPETIALITSKDAAAYTDIVRILNNRWSGLKILLVPVDVQGTSAPPSIVDAFTVVNGRTDIDVVIIARGGGAQEDLQAFNTEEVARAVFRCRHPVISAIGHERDVTIVDFVADVRASTPSNAAERVVADRREVTVAIDHLSLAVTQSLDQIMEDYHHIIHSFAHAGERWFDRCAQRLKHLTAMIENLSPQATMKRGYSITKDRRGRIIRAVASIASNDRVTTVVSDGAFVSTVLSSKCL